MSEKQVLLTGAFGNVGQWTLAELSRQDFKVIAFELKNRTTNAVQKRLAKRYKFETIWGDLTDKTQIQELILSIQPDAIVHVAAVIPPMAYISPEIAYRVNVKGTADLIEAAQQVQDFSRFVFTSSYTVHGPRNPHMDLPPITSDLAVNPQDSYAKQKLRGEQMLQESQLPYTILRLPAVLPFDLKFLSSTSSIKFNFLLDPDREESVVDPRDAGLAIANAVTAPTEGEILEISGDPEMGWTGRAGDLHARIYNAYGMSPFSDNFYRRADPEVDESWFYEGIIDPNRSQSLLQYQRYTFDEYLTKIRERMGLKRYFIKLFSPLIKLSLRRYSYKHTNGYDSRSLWEVVQEEFNIDDQSTNEK